MTSPTATKQADRRIVATAAAFSCLQLRPLAEDFTATDKVQASQLARKHFNEAVCNYFKLHGCQNWRRMTPRQKNIAEHNHGEMSKRIALFSSVEVWKTEGAYQARREHQKSLP